MILTLAATLLTIFVVLVNPIAVPLYATTAVDVKDATISINGYIDKFIQLPIIGTIITIILLVITIYLEFFLKINVGKLPKAIALLSILYASPLPYIYVVGFKDVVIVLSNFAKYLSLPIYTLAFLIAITEGMLSTSKRARIIADISTTEEKTERGM